MLSLKQIATEANLFFWLYQCKMKHLIKNSKKSIERESPNNNISAENCVEQKLNYTLKQNGIYSNTRWILLLLL